MTIASISEVIDPLYLYTCTYVHVHMYTCSSEHAIGVQQDHGAIALYTEVETENIVMERHRIATCTYFSKPLHVHIF